MNKSKPVVGIGFCGIKQDVDPKLSFRPTLALCAAPSVGEGLPRLARFELLCGEREAVKARSFAEEVMRQAGTPVRVHQLPFRDPWNFGRVYEAAYEFVRAYPFDHQREDYLAHISVGSEVKKISLFLLVLKGFLRARLLHSIPPVGDETPRFSTIDLQDAEHRFLRHGLGEIPDDVHELSGGIETRNESFRKLIEQILVRTIATDRPVLLLGETGAGKSFIAQTIYKLRRNRGFLKRDIFVDVNCATLSPDRAVADLFGAVKGAYSGMVGPVKGYLEEADGGVLFLDEIGELDLRVQGMLLKAIEEKVFTPLGATKVTNSDFQLICATNRDLRSDVCSGRFREDLYARIKMWPFTIPSLRERREDIAPLVDAELEQFAHRRQKMEFNPSARKRFMRFAESHEASWKANHRDLQMAVERMATLGNNGLITVDVVEDEITRLRSEWAIGGEAPSPLCERILNDSVGGLCMSDRVVLENALSVIQSSRSLAEAGRRLFEPQDGSKRLTNPSDRIIKFLASFGIGSPQLAALSSAR